jgi:hypothetical protein
MAFLDSYLYMARRMPDAASLHMSCFADPDFESAVARLSTKCMVNEAFKPLPASAIATGIIYFVRESNFCEPTWTPALSRLTGHDAPTSKSVQRVLELLDMLAGEEAEAMQRQLAAHAAEVSQLVDSSLEESRTEYDEETSLSAALESIRLPSTDSQDTAAEEAHAQGGRNSQGSERDDALARPALLSAAATRVLDFFGAASAKTAIKQLQQADPHAACASIVTPAAAVKTIGGEEVPAKSKFSPVSIADFE